MEVLGFRGMGFGEWGEVFVGIWEISVWGVRELRDKPTSASAGILPEIRVRWFTNGVRVWV